MAKLNQSISFGLKNLEALPPMVALKITCRILGECVPGDRVSISAVFVRNIDLGKNIRTRVFYMAVNNYTVGHYCRVLKYFGSREGEAVILNVDPLEWEGNQYSLAMSEQAEQKGWVCYTDLKTKGLLNLFAELPKPGEI